MKYVALYIISFILALLIVQFFEMFQGMLMGGLRTVIGFPIPYYIDVWGTPGIEKNEPWLKYINVLILYVPIIMTGSLILYYKKK